MNQNKKTIRMLAVLLSVFYTVCLLLIIFGILFCVGVFFDEVMLVPGLPMIGAAVMIIIFSSSILFTLIKAKKGNKPNPNKTFFDTSQTIDQAEEKEFYSGSVNDQLTIKYRGNLKCPKCGARRSSHARYCEYCGEPFNPTEKDNREDPYGK